MVELKEAITKERRIRFEKIVSCKISNEDFIYLKENNISCGRLLRLAIKDIKNK